MMILKITICRIIAIGLLLNAEKALLQLFWDNLCKSAEIVVKLLFGNKNAITQHFAPICIKAE